MVLEIESIAKTDAWIHFWLCLLGVGFWSGGFADVSSVWVWEFVVVCGELREGGLSGFGRKVEI